MRRIGLRLAFFTLLGVVPLAAQQPFPTATSSGAPRLEVGLGYTNVRATNVVTACCFHMNGGTASVGLNLNGWLGVVGDFGGYHQGNVRNSTFGLTVTSYTFGPRVSLRKNEYFTPFVHALFGGAHAGGTLYTSGFTLGSSGGRNSFATVIGGGIDANITRRVAIRVVQADWLFTEFPNGNTNRQHNLRLTTGLVFHFGGR